jgi:malate dehydrogenase (oxaloacetate-decarboxylating)(NADP+)
MSSGGRITSGGGEVGVLSPAELDVLASIGTVVSHAPGDVVIEEGAPASGFSIIESGSVEVSRNGRPVGRVGELGVVGEMALFNADVRTAEVRALEACRVLFVPAEQFVQLVLEQEPAAVKVMESLGQLMVGRLQQLESELLERVEGEPVEELVAMRKRMLAEWALAYHALGKPGKLTVSASKRVGTAADLAVAYSPGVAEPCLAIRETPERAFDFTSRAHLVGVITNGTAVLGLGNIGALASKPVMEGKAVLFKRFADLDAFDVEIDEQDPERFVDIVCALAPTFGGINLEDIRAPDCFFIEEECKRRCDIPIFHDDQHGTAIVAGAGLLNALELVGKRIDDVRVVFSGAGAAGFACAKFFLLLGVRREHLVLADVHGVVHRGRGDGNYLDELAAETDARTLAEAIVGADVFVGVSAPDVMTPEMLLTMGSDPIVFALANPVPEIDYRLARQTRPDAVVATGRSDYPNQVNNVIAFPHIFRAALDTRARTINEEMKLAAAHAIAELAREPSGETAFGPEYVIPKPFDTRLLPRVARAVAGAAMATGSARQTVDLDSYERALERITPAASG